MRWREIDKYHAESDKDYKVSRANVGERVTYASWAPKANEFERRECLGYSPNFEEARQLCELHLIDAERSGDGDPSGTCEGLEGQQNLDMC